MDIQKIGPRTLKRPQEGDIFVFSFDNKEYYFGRVIKLDVIAGGFPGAVLIYAYDQKTNKKKLIPLLNKENLLIPPVMINRMPWTRGYFEVVEHKVLLPEDVFEKHIFKTDNPNISLDEYGNRMQNVVANYGYSALSSYLSFSEKVSLVLDDKRKTT
ncbi:MAG: immunity 26/phosphotriesterase HocA family protein [Candidatus Roizmanbacteria bacterium]